MYNARPKADSLAQALLKAQGFSHDEQSENS